MFLNTVQFGDRNTSILGFPDASDSSLPEIWKTQLWSLGQEDLLEKEMATHTSILAWKIPRTEGASWATFYAVAKGQTQLSN